MGNANRCPSLSPWCGVNREIMSMTVTSVSHEYLVIQPRLEVKSGIQIVSRQYDQCHMEMDCLYLLHLQIHKTLKPLPVRTASLGRLTCMNLVLQVNHHLALILSVRLI